MTLAAFVALCSGILGKPVQSQMVVLGSMSLGGNSVPVENLAGSLQAAFDAGAKRILLPMASVGDIPTIPGELFGEVSDQLLLRSTGCGVQESGGRVIVCCIKQPGCIVPPQMEKETSVLPLI